MKIIALLFFVSQFNSVILYGQNECGERFEEYSTGRFTPYGQGNETVNNIPIDEEVDATGQPATSLDSGNSNSSNNSQPVAARGFENNSSSSSRGFESGPSSASGRGSEP